MEQLHDLRAADRVRVVAALAADLAGDPRVAFACFDIEPVLRRATKEAFGS